MILSANLIRFPYILFNCNTKGAYCFHNCSFPQNFIYSSYSISVFHSSELVQMNCEFSINSLHNYLLFCNKKTDLPVISSKSVLYVSNSIYILIIIPVRNTSYRYFLRSSTLFNASHGRSKSLRPK